MYNTYVKSGPARKGKRRFQDVTVTNTGTICKNVIKFKKGY
jgi:hypothetical protein